jgi:hypothetical protein
VAALVTRVIIKSSSAFASSPRGGQLENYIMKGEE